LEMRIVPHVGVGRLRLGLNRDQVMAVLGSPSSTETQRFKYISDISEVWTYEHLGLDLTFQSDEAFLLGCISVSSREAELNGEKLIGLEEGILLARLAAMGFPVVLDEEFESVSSKEYDCKKASMTFWVEAGFLESIGVMPEYDADDAVIRPSL